MSVGERIMELRKKQNISQGQLAQALAVSRHAVSKWENDQASPDTLKLIKLADLLDTEVEYLATGRHPVYESPPIVVNLVKREDKVIEKVVEKPVVKHITRVKYYRNPIELVGLGLVCFVFGLILGFFL